MRVGADDFGVNEDRAQAFTAVGDGFGHGFEAGTEVETICFEAQEARKAAEEL